LSKATATPFVGLEIGDDEIRLATATPEGDECLVHCRRRALPQGAVQSGYVAEPDAVVEALRSLLAASASRPRRACLVLGGERTICRVEPLMEGHEPAARDACADRMRRYLIFGGHPATVGHVHQGGAGPDAGGGWMLSAATLCSLVAQQIAVAKRCGLSVVRAEPAMAALVRMLLTSDQAERPSYLLVARAGGCEVGTVRRDGLIFCHRLAGGAQALVGDGDMLSEVLEQLADYHFRHARGREPIEEMRCCGAKDDLERLFGRLASEGVRAQWLDPAAFAGVGRLECEDVTSQADRAALAPAVAAALCETGAASRMGYLDLLPPKNTKKRSLLLSASVVVPAVLTLLITTGLGTWDWLARRQTRRLTHLMNHPTAGMLECSQLLMRDSQLKQRRAEAELLLASVPRKATVAFLCEVPRRLLREVWLERLDISRTGVCVVEGMAHTEDVVFSFTESLRQSPYVEAVRMGGTGSEREGGLILTRFRLDVVLADALQPAPKKKEETP